MAKYHPLFEFLCRAPDTELEMSFDEIARLVGGLPASARTSRTWWANETGAARHVQAKAWLDAGRIVEQVDLTAERVHFSRARWTRGS